jgi:hypothetical protein
MTMEVDIVFGTIISVIAKILKGALSSSQCFIPLVNLDTTTAMDLVFKTALMVGLAVLILV